MAVSEAWTLARIVLRKIDFIGAFRQVAVEWSSVPTIGYVFGDLGFVGVGWVSEA